MATLNLGRIKPVFRGAYSGGTAYVVDDIVTSGGSTYICIQAHGAGTQAVTVTAYWSVLASTGTGVGTTITTQGDILYRDGSGLQRLAKPASNKFLQNTSGGVVSWESMSSDYVKLASNTLSGAVSTVAFDVFDDSVYQSYKLVGQVSHSNNGMHLHARIRTASGDYTGSNYARRGMQSYRNTTGTNNTLGAWNTSTTADKILLQDWGNNNNTHQYPIFLEIINTPDNRSFIKHDDWIWDASGTPYYVHQTGITWVNETTAKTGISIFPSANTLNIGSNFVIWGLKR